MIAMVQSNENLQKERHEATLRKQKQLEDAEREHERLVAEEEAQELAEQKRKQEEEEKAALEAARNSPQARMMQAANEAAAQINVSELEANIAANLQ